MRVFSVAALFVVGLWASDLYAQCSTGSCGTSVLRVQRTCTTGSCGTATTVQRRAIQPVRQQVILRRSSQTAQRQSTPWWAKRSQPQSTTSTDTVLRATSATQEVATPSVADDEKAVRSVVREEFLSFLRERGIRRGVSR